MIAYFFYIDGVNTVIHMSTSYGETLNLDQVGMIFALLVTQVVAFPAPSSSAASPRLRLTADDSLRYCAVFLYLRPGLLHGFQRRKRRRQRGIHWHNAADFVLDYGLPGRHHSGWYSGAFRSHFGKLVPPAKSNEYFGFFDIFGKFATVMGPL